MNIRDILDNETIRTFRRFFYEITGMFTCYSFPERKNVEVDLIPPNAKHRFCKILQSCEKGLELCRLSDEAAIGKGENAKRPLVYTCHAGITGIIVPVFSNGEYRGALCTGDVLTRKPTKTQMRRVISNLSALGLDPVELEKSYNEIPVVSRQSIKIAVEMLSMMVNYIIDREQLLILQEAIYVKQKEVADSLIERTVLEKDLQDKVEEIGRLRKVLLASAGSDRAYTATNDGDLRYRRIIQKAVSFIDQYYSEDLTLKEVAAYVGLSPKYLSKLFHKTHGSTFADYVTYRRISKACEMLEDLSLNVTEVAFRVGYSNTSYFSRLFKKVVGMTPGKYRNSVDCHK